LKPLHHIFFSLIFVATSLTVCAQNSGNRITKRIAVSGETQQLDSLPIVKGSVSIPLLDSSEYSVNHILSTIRFSSAIKMDSVEIEYRRMSFSLTKEYRHKDIKLILPYETVNPFSYIPKSEKINYFN
jgi:hypothetical protein